MELLEEIKSSLENQSREQGKTLCSSSNRSYIAYSLSWKLTIEGYLFWWILHYSYYHQGIYDYITIMKLYGIYGKSVFKAAIHGIVHLIYSKDFCNESNTLSGVGFERLCKELEMFGVVRIDRFKE